MALSKFDSVGDRKIIFCFRHGERDEISSRVKDNPSIFGHPINEPYEYGLDLSKCPNTYEKHEKLYFELYSNVHAVTKIINGGGSRFKIVCSPFLRTIQTANLVRRLIINEMKVLYGKDFSIGLEIDEELGEIGEKVESMKQAKIRKDPNLSNLNYNISFNTDATVGDSGTKVVRS